MGETLGGDAAPGYEGVGKVLSFGRQEIQPALVEWQG